MQRPDSAGVRTPPVPLPNCLGITTVSEPACQAGLCGFESRLRRMELREAVVAGR